MNLYTIMQKTTSEWVKENVKIYVLYDHTARVEFKELDRFGDNMEAYIVNQKDGSTYLTDDGLSLMEIAKADGGEEISQIAEKYEITLTEDGELMTMCGEEDFAEKAEALLACMKEVRQCV